MDSHDTLVGSAPSEPTNQPTNDTPILYCEATGLYYVGSDGRTCEKERQIGSIAIHPAYAFQLDGEWDPVKLRAQVAKLEAERHKASLQLDNLTLSAEVYQNIARELTEERDQARADVERLRRLWDTTFQERDRARGTAAALEEELHAAVLNLRHTRETLAITDSFLADLRRWVPSFHARVIDQYLASECPVCTPDDKEVVVEADHPLFQTSRPENN